MTARVAPGTSTVLKHGYLALLIGLGGFGLWAGLVPLNGAVIASGQVMVEARRQAIQHPDGGLVAVLHVRDGDKVSKGEPVLTLDGTEHLAQKEMLQMQHLELEVRSDRLLAEIKGAVRFDVVVENVAAASASAEFVSLVAEETALFEARQATLLQSFAQLDERKRQSEAIILGRERLLAATRDQLASTLKDLEARERLLAQGLIETERVSVLTREAARLDGEIGDLEAGIAEVRSAIAGYGVERLRLEAAFREEAQSERRDLQARIGAIEQELRLVETRISRLVLRAPMDGTVFGLQVFTVGGVIPAGAEVASLVPSGAPLVISVEIDPLQIDRVHVGQEAVIRFPALNARTTPEVPATIHFVSADAALDPVTGRRLYAAELSLGPDATRLLVGVPLQPGMPVEVFVQTDARTPASFLFKPLADYWSYAMREE